MTQRFLLLLLVAGTLMAAGPGVAVAQERGPRFGLGFNALLTTADGFGLGFRGRVSAPVNADLSLGMDLGFTGFLLGGRDDARYVFDPQVSAIVTLPGRADRAPYFLGGLGAYIPVAADKDDNAEGGPTLHGGIGWVQLLTETTIFYEINPALLIGPESVDILLPVRIGVIF